MNQPSHPDLSTTTNNTNNRAGSFFQAQPSPEQILAQQAALVRTLKARSLAQKQQQEQSRTMHSAVLLDFDADVGLYKCQLVDGSIVMARSISSSGGKGIGDVVSLSRNQGTNVIRYL